VINSSKIFKNKNKKEMNNKCAKIRGTSYEGEDFISKIPVPCDFEIHVGKEAIKCHFLIMAMTIPFFACMKTFGDGKKEHRLEIDVRDTSVFDFVRSVYTEVLEVTKENARDMMLLADYWGYWDVSLIQKLAFFLSCFEKELPEAHALSRINCSERGFNCNSKTYGGSTLRQYGTMDGDKDYVRVHFGNGTQSFSIKFDTDEFERLFLGVGIIWQFHLDCIFCHDMITREKSSVCV